MVSIVILRTCTAATSGQRAKVVIIPVGLGSATDEVRKVVVKCEEVLEKLVAAGIRARADLRDNNTPGLRFLE